MRASWTVLVAIVACAPPNAPRPAPPDVSSRPSTRAAAGGTAETAASSPDATLVRPCPRPSPEAQAAEVALQRISAKVYAIGAADDPKPLESELRALAAMPCFALAFEDGVTPLEWTSGLALRTWWQDGGHEWFATYLALGDVGSQKTVATAPTPRRALTVDTSAGHPLLPLLCPLQEVDRGACGIETAGWVIRANVALHLRPGLTTTHPHGRSELCATQARSGESQRRIAEIHQLKVNATPYAFFRACVNDVAQREESLPLGAFRAPKHGWFIVMRGVFISPSGCHDNLGVYDLATGAAYRYRCLPNASPAQLYVGRVHLGALREAAWMAMLTTTTERDVRLAAETFEVPTGMTIERRRGERVPPLRLIASETDTPMYVWSWMRSRPGGVGPAGRASGVFHDARVGAGRHAAELLEIVEASFERGCAPAPPPRPIPWRDLGPQVNPDREGNEAHEPLVELLDHHAEARRALGAASPGAGSCPVLP
jgi:hypothetical protein